MGGGDLNLKKSWHPHTMKNQERVWKAEQAKQEEQRKLDDLRKEINEERDREELRRIGENSGVLGSSSSASGGGGAAKLEWMYKNNTELINREEYLLGRKIDKSFETLEAEERRQEQNKSALGVKQSINHVEHDCVPFSIREYRNLQSTEQVDMQRKTLEDPLMLIKQREMESRRKLLENPVKLKEIHRILKTEQELKAKKMKKSKKSKKKNNSDGSEDSDEDLDRKLARQVKKLKGDNGNGDLKLDKLLDAKYRTISKQLDMATKQKKGKKRRGSSSSSSSSSQDSSDSEERGNRRRKDNSSEEETHVRRTDKGNRGRDQDQGRHQFSQRDSRRNISRSPQRDRRRNRTPSPRREQRQRSHQGISQRQRSPQKSTTRRERDLRSPQRTDQRRKSPPRRDQHNFSNQRSSPYQRRTQRSPPRRNMALNNTQRSPTRRDQRRKSSPSPRRSPSRRDHRRKISPSPRRSPARRDQSRKSPLRSLQKSPPPRRSPPRKERDRRDRSRDKGPAARKPKLSSAEREARLREMMDNANWREADRTRSVQKHREASAREEAQHRSRDFDKDFINKEVKKAIANQHSIGDRIRSNLNNIQRNSSAMDTNFARK